MKPALIAILRGIQPHEIESIVETLLECGIQTIEVPLNSPLPYVSITKMIQRFAGMGTFGAGTVLNVEQVSNLASIGVQMIVSPNCNLDVIEATKSAGMQSFPGVMTPTECFAALNAGADGLKFFPGELIETNGLKAMRAVLPTATQCIVVGGTKPENFSDWLAVGATGFGIGSALYKAGDSVAEVRSKAQNIVHAYNQAISA